MYNKNYLVINQFEQIPDSKDYRLEMIKRNSIEGLMELDLYIEDNDPNYYYDISLKQSLSSCFYDTKIQKDQIICFFTSLHNVIININKFMLDYDNLVLLPQCIFCNKEMNNYFFAYCPSYKQDFFLSLKELISYILTITNHDDEKTVLISYALWQETQNENYNLKSLMNVIEKYNNSSNTVNVSNIPSVIADNIEDKNNILKEPDILLRENYTYETSFILKNSLVFGLTFLALVINIVFKLFSIYSTETFFVILIALMVFTIFYTSKLIRIAPLYKTYDKPIENANENVIHINTSLTLPECKEENNETILLCVNPEMQNKYLIYTGIDFSQEIQITEYPFLIGKADNNHLVINHPAVSRNHARIIFDNGSYFIEDLNSSNGTKINDEIIPSYTLTEINTKDTITFAHLTYIFQ